MNWMEIGLAAASGGLAALIAGLVLRKWREKKGVYVVVFVLLFAVLSGLSKIFLLPILNLPTQMAETEKAFQTIPAYQALKKYDPAVYAAMMEEIRGSLKKGVKQDVLTLQLRAKLGKLLEKRLPQASDAALTQYVGVMAQEIRALTKQSPDLCFKFMFPEKYGVVDARKHLTKELIDADFLALSEVIKTSAESPQPIPSEAEIKDDLLAAFTALQKRHGNAAQVLQALDGPSVDKLVACNVVTDMYGEVLRMPPARSARLLRYLLA